jgi:hypothetical protein
LGEECPSRSRASAVPLDISLALAGRLTLARRKPLKHPTDSEMDVIEHVDELKHHAQLIDEI